MDKAGDTIVAIATPPGRGGIGIVRLSGPQARPIAQSLAAAQLTPRHAHYHRLCDDTGAVIDDAVIIYFKGPRSYTGEDVVELQMHGSPVLLSQILRRCVTLGARRARPGEFSERAYLNERLDLAQAEAVADLINAGSEAAARAARRSLDGEFSRRVHALLELLIQLRVYIEASLDFPEEEIDFLAAPELRGRWQQTDAALIALRRDAERGVRLLDGLHAVIIGAPNVGKSSLLNALAGEERAIVTDIAGTTRDLLREAINLDGVALLLVDTAGLRQSGDAIEAEGMRRARAELARADLVLAVLDDTNPGAQESLSAEVKGAPKVVWVHNKADLSGRSAEHRSDEAGEHLWLSARTGEGLEGLRQLLARQAGQEVVAGGAFSARSRHLEALAATAAAMAAAGRRLAEGNGELAADDLAQAQHALAEITGAMDADALLGRIFSSFCIGK